MGASIPKQYLQLCGKAIMCHTLDRLTAVGSVAGIVLALGAEDEYWQGIAYRAEKPLVTVTGGEERCYSVLNALRWLLEQERAPEWVLVHDAARPCVRTDEVERFITAMRSSPHGGLLGVPLSDTIKRSNAGGEVIATVERGGLWRALTPQMFRLQALHDAITRAIAAGELVTDEAAAMELAGYAPRLVEGSADNIKVTRPVDLKMAEFFLGQQENNRCG